MTIIACEDLFVREREHRPASASASSDLELAICGWLDNEVRQKAARCNAGFAFCIGGRITKTVNITRQLNELV